MSFYTKSTNLLNCVALCLIPDTGFLGELVLIKDIICLQHGVLRILTGHSLLRIYLTIFENDTLEEKLQKIISI